MSQRKFSHNSSLKRVFALLLAAVMLFGYIQMPAAFAETEYAEDIEGVSISVSFRDGAEKNAAGDYVWTTKSSNADHEFIYRITYAFSGEKAIPVDSVEMRIPASILKDLNGNKADYFKMSIPKDDDPNLTPKNTWVYKIENTEDGEFIVVYNRFEISTAEQGYFEVSYVTKYKTYVLPDYAPGVSAEDSLTGYAKNGSMPMEASLSYLGNVKESVQAEPVYIDTTAYIKSAEKTIDNEYNEWKDAWGEEPADSEEYRYLVWKIRSIVVSTGQAYDFSITDTFDAGEVVGYKMAGQTSFTSAENGGGVVRGETASYPYGRYDYVLTRYLIDPYDGIDRYELTNDIVSTVTPAQGYDQPTQASATGKYIYEQHGFDVPQGWFYAYKFGFDNKDQYVKGSNQILKYDLEDFAEQNFENYDGFYFYTYVHGYPNSFTVEDGQDTHIKENYWKVPVTYTLEDHEIRLKSVDKEDFEYVTLTKEDYEITSFKLDILENSPHFNEQKQSFSAIPAIYEETDIVYIYVQVNDEEEGGEPVWNLAATYNLYDLSLSTENATYVASRDGKTYNFINTDSQIITGFKVQTTNAKYYTKLGGYPYIRLKNTQKVLDIARDAMAEGNQHKIVLSNKSDSNVTRKGKQLVAFTKYGYEYALGITREGQMKKSVVSHTNDSVNKQYRVTWKVEASESYKDGEGVVNYIPQNSGIFYDLLPKNALYKEGSVKVKVGNTVLEDGLYSVEQLPNYRNTGRTLIIIRVSEHTDDKYTVEFTSVHPWDTISGYSSGLDNDALYETGNEDIGKGEDKDSWVISLDGVTEAQDGQKKFLHDSEHHDISVITSASLGLFKKVWAEGDDDYGFETTVATAGYYDYMIRFAIADGASHSKDMILFDSIENYIPKDDPDGGDWVGTLQSIDVSSIRALGCDPVIWYTASDSFDPEELNTAYVFEEHSDVWKSAEDFGDLSLVRGFAIDMRKASGSDEVFDIGPEDNIIVLVHMKAPDGAPAEPLDPVVYNSIALYSTVYDKLAPDLSESALIWHEYTIVHLHVFGDLRIRKVDEQDPEKAIKGIKFRLTGTSRYGKDYDEIRTTETNGYASFLNIEAGNYELSEIEANDNYVLDGDPISVTIDLDGNVKIDGAQIDPETGIITSPYEHVYSYTDGIYYITNTPRIHGDLNFMKVEKHGSSAITVRLEGARFRLTGTSNYGTKYSLEAVSGDDGIAEFENIEWGTYTLTEIEAPDGYIKDDTEYTAEILSNGLSRISYTDEDGNLVIISQNPTSGEFEIINEPYHNFKLYKYDEVSSQFLEGAEFRLTGTSEYGRSVDMTVPTNANGVAVFSMLEPGTYVLKETVAPKNYVLDETERVVTITKTGEVTIDGLEFDETYGWFKVPNPRLLEGVINIVKVWDDRGFEQERGSVENGTFPVVQVDTTEPDVTMPFATIDKDKWVTGVRSNYKFQGGKDFFCTNQAGYRARFIRNTEITSVDELPTTNRTLVRIDDGQTDYHVYAWKIGGTSTYNGNTVETVYWWSDAEVIFLPENCERMFWKTRLIELDLSDFNTSKVTNMKEMFCLSYYLTTINVTGWDTSNVTNMNMMFAYEGEYQNNQWLQRIIGIEGFNTSKVTDMAYMFSKNTKLGTDNNYPLDVSHFDTSNVTDMSHMFHNCTGLKSLDVSHFDTSNVINMSYMFYGCSSLTSLDVSHFDTSNVVHMSSMFNSCQKLETLDVTHFDTSNVTDMGGMFGYCYKLKDLDVTHFDTSNVHDFTVGSTRVMGMSGMFSHCRALTSIDVTHFDTSNVTSMASMFYNCESLESVDVTHFDTSQVNNMMSMFEGCKSLTTIDVSHFDTSNVTDMSYMFKDCENLVALDLSYFDTSKVKNMSYMFYGCAKLKTIDLSTFNTPSLTNVNNMFKGCAALESIDLSRLNTSNVTNMSYMFEGCTSLTSLDLSYNDTSKVTNMSYMFKDCVNLKDLNVSRLVTSSVTSMKQMFLRCSSLEELDVSHFDTAKVTDISSFVEDCSSLKSLDISHFNTSNVTDMSWMFAGCTLLEDLDISHLDTKKCTNFSYMFERCKNLKDFNCSSFDMSAANNLRYMFRESGAVSIVLDLSKRSNNNAIYYLEEMCKGCESLEKFTLWDSPDRNIYINNTTSATNTSYGRVFTSMFEGCKNLKIVDFSSIEGFKVTTYTNSTKYYVNMSNMFKGCESLQVVAIPGLYNGGTGLGYINFATEMFSGCANLQRVYVDGDHWAFGTNASAGMFTGCTAIVGQNGTAYDSTKTDKTYARIDVDGTPGYLWDLTTAEDGDIPTSGATINTAQAPLDVVILGPLELLTPADPSAPKPVTIIPPLPVTKLDFVPPDVPASGTAPVGYIEGVDSKYITVSQMYEGPETDTSEIKDLWIDNGDNTWTYRMSVFEAESTYYAWEQNMEDYTTEYSLDRSNWTQGPTIELDYKGGIEGEDPTVLYVKNSRTAEGGLTVKKRVEAPADSELNENDTALRFVFTITLTDNTESQAIAPLLEGTKVFGGLAFTDGVATITLAHDESYTVTGLPAGASYIVTEAPEEAYTTTSTGSEGFISEGVTKVAEFVNRRNEEEKFGAFTLEKIVDSGNKQKEFVFNISFSNLVPGVTYTYGNESFTADQDGNAHVEIGLASGQSVRFDRLPVGAMYIVTEEASEYVASFEVTEQSENGIVITPSGANETEGKSLSTALEDVEADEDALIVFTNNVPGFDIPIIKVDASGDNVTGAVLQILSGDEVFDEWTTVASAHVVKLPKGEYVLHEKEAPKGWVLADDIEFEILSDGTLAVGGSVVEMISMQDDQTEVKIRKVSEDGKALKGAKLEILDETGKSIYTWISKIEAEVIIGRLETGKVYTLHEVSAPKGFEVAPEDISFSISDKGQLLNADGEPVNDIVMTDPRIAYGDLRITKYLTKFELSEDATFVFDVVGTKGVDDEGKPIVVYSNVAVLTFSKDAPAASMSTILEHIPSGALVTVTEVYTGSHYELTTEADQTAEIVAAHTVSVNFTNDYNEEETGGHGAANIFDPVEPGEDNNGWKWERKGSTRLKDPALPDFPEVEEGGR